MTSHVLEPMGDAVNDPECWALSVKGLSPLRWGSGIRHVVNHVEGGHAGEEGPPPRARIVFKFGDRWIDDFIGVLLRIHAGHLFSENTIQAGKPSSFSPRDTMRSASSGSGR
jgi:hypothetical protein